MKLSEPMRKTRWGEKQNFLYYNQLKGGEEGVKDFLTDVSTKELVEELKRRSGTKTTIAEPYQDVAVKVNGPAIVLVVND